MEYLRLVFAFFLCLPIAVHADSDLLTSGQSVESHVAQDEINQYKISAVKGQTVTGVLDQLNADADLFINIGLEAGTNVFDCKSDNSNTQTDSCSVTLENNADVYISVHGYQASNYRLTATAVSQAHTELTSGVSIESHVAQNAINQYKISAVKGQTVTGVLDQLSADADLFINIGSEAGTNAFDCKSDNSNTQTDSCSVTLENNADVYISVHGYQASNYRLTATAVSQAHTELTSGESIESHVAQNAINQYKISAVKGQTVTGVLDQLSADADLFINIGSEAGTNAFDCKSDKSNTQADSCLVTLEDDADVYISVHGYQGANYRLTVTLEDKTVGLIWGKDTTLPSSSWSRPVLNEEYKDPAYGTTIKRVTSTDNGTRFNRNTYSRIQIENADGSYFLAYNGDTYYHVYRTGTSTLLRTLNIATQSQVQWHPTNPNLIRYVTKKSNSFKLYEMNVNNGDTSTLVDLKSRIRALFSDATYMHDGHEGSPSKDGNRYAWMIDDADDNLLGFISYDLSSDQILGHIDNIPKSIGVVDWISTSPSGEYIIAGSGDKYRQPNIVTKPGVYVFDKSFSKPSFTIENLIFKGIEHSDIGITKDGDDMYIYIDFDSALVKGYNLRTKKYVDLFNFHGNFASMHISAKNFNTPGWVLISTYGGNEGAWTYQKIFAVDLAGNEHIANLAHSYNCVYDGEDEDKGGYFQETHAVVNRDFSRVYYNSTSNRNKTLGGCGYDGDHYYTEIYQISVPILEAE